MIAVAPVQFINGVMRVNRTTTPYAPTNPKAPSASYGNTVYWNSNTQTSKVVANTNDPHPWTSSASSSTLMTTSGLYTSTMNTSTRTVSSNSKAIVSGSTYATQTIKGLQWPADVSRYSTATAVSSTSVCEPTTFTVCAQGYFPKVQSTVCRVVK